MNTKRSHYGRKPSADFGSYLKTWRLGASLTQEEAALKLGLGGKHPGAYLSQIEAGKKPIPDAPLLKVSQVYGVRSEQVLTRAYSPQLPLPLLSAVMDVPVISGSIEQHLGELEANLEADQKRELASYAAFLLARRQAETSEQRT